MWRLVFQAGKLLVKWADDIPKGASIVSIHGSKKQAQSALTSAQKKVAKGERVEGKPESKLEKEARLDYVKESKKMGEENLQKYLKKESKRLLKPAESEASMLKRKHGSEVRKKLTDLGYKSKGGSVKKYAKGGGVRAVRY
tara:strand:- start:5712 stop:6134 length:423 start_codon:yes stop_codon:yes gene_type:complete